MADPKVKVDKTGPQATVETVEVNPSNEVVDYAQQLRDMAIGIQENERVTGNWISFKGGILMINGQPMKDNKAPCIVLNSIHENQLYKGRYNPNDQQPPICFAFAENEKDLKPHQDSLEPQAESCKVCPKNAWNTDPDGGKGKACKNVRRIEVIARDDLENVDKAEVYFAKLPVMSVANWSVYANQLVSVLKAPPICFVTEMSVTPDPRSQFKVNFALLDKVDPIHFPALLKKRNETEQLLYAPYEQPVFKEEQQPRANTKY